MLSVTGYNATIGQTVLLTAVYFIVCLLVPAILDRGLRAKFGAGISVWLNLVVLAATAVLFFAVLTKNTQSSISFFHGITVTGLLLAVGCSAFFFLALDHFLDPIFDRMFPKSAEQYKQTITTLQQHPAASFIRISLYAPITEELLIRGFILCGLLSGGYSPAVALILSTVIFAVIHFNFVQTLSAVICGVVLGLLYLYTGSIFCSILAHALYNMLSYFKLLRGTSDPATVS